MALAIAAAPEPNDAPLAEALRKSKVVKEEEKLKNPLLFEGLKKFGSIEDAYCTQDLDELKPAIEIRCQHEWRIIEPKSVPTEGLNVNPLRVEI